MFQSHVEGHGASWGHDWRSSDAFIVSTMGLALFTDELLFAFMLPLLPTMLENRIGLDPSLTQRYTSIFLAEGALVSILSSPFIGSMTEGISSKKTLLLALLMLALISTAFLSLTRQLVWLFVGRFFQCLTSNALWIVGMATMAENLGTENMGKIAGLSSTLTAAGTAAGPVLAGLLFEMGGYWCAWAGALAFLMADIVMRLIMVEKPVDPQQVTENLEQGPLLQDGPPVEQANRSLSSWRFHVCVFREPLFSAGVFCAYAYAVMIGSFESTLVVHVRMAFGWGALRAGFLLALIQGPGIALAAPVGWMKDRIGSRTPTTVGFFSLIPFIVLLGVLSDDLFPWVKEAWGKSLYVVCTAMTGCLLSLLSGVGTMQATETIDALEVREPGKFGPNGGFTRALAVINMTWMAGLITGPLLAEFVVGSFGYFVLQCCLGVISLVAGLMALLFLGSLRPKSVPR
ncbi:hypothetical protein N7495_004589 [Penicillium taxi]|uniref:uncharacterized protein n=1 Tax=Penicillium taxi TaxID=168475 RepID=UPI002545217C|nr:uncharacterized protein N7495_004589 [Penicillium taxi]KAJ5899845.1 hypothetical protein N7495_004589 [Penicillium taxi]